MPILPFGSRVKRGILLERRSNRWFEMVPVKPVLPWIVDAPVTTSIFAPISLMVRYGRRLA